MIEQLFSDCLLAQGDTQGVVSVRHTPSRKLLWRAPGHDKTITVLAWSPDGRYLASGSKDQTIKVWDASRGQLLQTYTEHADEVWVIAWSPDGKNIVSSAIHESPRIWTLPLAQRSSACF